MPHTNHSPPFSEPYSTGRNDTGLPLFMFAIRKFRVSTFGFALSALLVLGGVAGAASSPTVYDVVEIGSIDQTLGEIVRGPDNAGGVIGGTAGFGFGTRAFHLTRSEVKKIPALPGSDRSIAHGTNAQGMVVGSSNTATALHAFLWAGQGNAKDLGTLPGDSASEALAINNHNEVAGYSSGPKGMQAVLWSADGKIRGLGVLSPGDHSRAASINDLGQVAGSSGQGGKNRAFLWTRAGGLINLGALPGDTESVAVGINRHTQVVGYSSGPNGTRAFIWTRARGMKDLGALPGHDYIRAHSINDHGAVVGVSSGSSGARAFLWTNGSAMRDLNSMVKLDGDFILVQGVGINDQGTILAIARDDEGHGDAHDNHEAPARMMLLTPKR